MIEGVEPDLTIIEAQEKQMEEARKPEFSQCFGDKAALEELTDGECDMQVVFFRLSLLV